MNINGKRAIFKYVNLYFHQNWLMMMYKKVLNYCPALNKVCGPLIYKAVKIRWTKCRPTPHHHHKSAHHSRFHSVPCFVFLPFNRYLTRGVLPLVYYLNAEIIIYLLIRGIVDQYQTTKAQCD